mmetsp:Transcript_9039/g.16582  ORF Transcript_9039/g.16582 Transcript_9039/m.16582 type:complete len:361 (+) Transcript_9039:77-1159(+)|eukprot:CAMPEP_0197517570 /NCGR_PEP_ID=MMETSP1318-20131121/2615_1 /TAXON_ID=552666 /ORGANISM="Partenskyella glossopodia, Strain RCC365" /LENGTH=360 /DNA_ID=CAMNT_0043067249 /DNA_START=42 /DNA_END=1124 /DNA_ORIENTATION=+
MRRKGKDYGKILLALCAGVVLCALCLASGGESGYGRVGSSVAGSFRRPVVQQIQHQKQHQHQHRRVQCFADRTGVGGLTRRQSTRGMIASIPTSLLLLQKLKNPPSSIAEEISGPEASKSTKISKIFVAGATGNTGKRTLDYLKKAYPNVQVTAGVRSLEKAKKQGILDENNVKIQKFDVTDTNDAIKEAIKGADAVVCVTGFVPGNPFSMNKAAHAVDNEGTIKLIDSAKEAGVSKFVLVSSILTNGRAWGQQDRPGFKITNAFGGVLDEKLEAENYLRKSGLDFTIVRPGGLKDTEPAGTLVVTPEDKLFTGEISRDRVAQVLAEAVFDQKASNKVVEIIEDESKAETKGVAEIFVGI